MWKKLDSRFVCYMESGIVIVAVKVDDEAAKLGYYALIRILFQGEIVSRISPFCCEDWQKVKMEEFKRLVKLAEGMSKDDIQYKIEAAWRKAPSGTP